MPKSWSFIRALLLHKKKKKNGSATTIVLEMAPRVIVSLCECGLKIFWLALITVMHKLAFYKVIDDNEKAELGCF